MNRIFLRIAASACFIWGAAVAMMPGTSEASCVLLRFTDETRYEKIGAAEILSDLVMEKLLASGKVSFKETRPLDAEAEALLYDEHAAERKNVVAAMDTGNYDLLFEGEGFNDKKAASVGRARRGQIVSPEIVAEIGRKHGAGYLLQGTILCFGTGQQIENDLGNAASFASRAANAFGLEKLATGLGLLGSMKTEKNSLGVLAVMRVIRADTGEVVWVRDALGKSTVSRHITEYQEIVIGNDRLTDMTFAKAMDNAAELLTKALLADMGKEQLPRVF